MIRMLYPEGLDLIFLSLSITVARSKLVPKLATLGSDILQALNLDSLYLLQLGSRLGNKEILRGG